MANLRKAVNKPDDLVGLLKEVRSLRKTLVQFGRVAEAKVLVDLGQELLKEALPQKEKRVPITQVQRTKMQRQLKRHMPKRKQWLCCTKPTLERIKGGKRAWVATCRYRIGSQTRAMKRIVGRDPRQRPMKIEFSVGKNGPRKKVRWC